PTPKSRRDRRAPAQYQDCESAYLSQPASALLLITAQVPEDVDLDQKRGGGHGLSLGRSIITAERARSRQWHGTHDEAPARSRIDRFRTVVIGIAHRGRDDAWRGRGHEMGRSQMSAQARSGPNRRHHGYILTAGRVSPAQPTSKSIIAYACSVPFAEV